MSKFSFSVVITIIFDKAQNTQTLQHDHDKFVIFASTHFAKCKAVIIRSEAGRDIANIRRKLFFGGSVFLSTRLFGKTRAWHAPVG